MDFHPSVKELAAILPWEVFPEQTTLASKRVGEVLCYIRSFFLDSEHFSNPLRNLQVAKIRPLSRGMPWLGLTQAVSQHCWLRKSPSCQFFSCFWRFSRSRILWKLKYWWRSMVQRRSNETNQCLLASWTVIVIQARIKSLAGMEIKSTDFRIISGAAKIPCDMIASDIAPGVKARIYISYVFLNSSRKSGPVLSTRKFDK